MKKETGGFIHWALVLAVVSVIVLIFLIFIGPGKHLRREYAQQKLSSTSEPSDNIEKVVRELVKTAVGSRELLLEKYIQPALPQDKKSSILNALEILSSSKEYRLYSVNRYGSGFIKAVFYYSGTKEEGQIPFLLTEEKNKLFFLEIL